MADKKISQLSTMTQWSSEDRLLVIDDPNGTPTGKTITTKNFFGNVNANTVLNARVRMKANTTIVCSNTVVTSNVNITSNGLLKANNIIVTTRSNPSTNNATTEGYKTGQIFFSNTYIYVAVNATTLKRASLSTF